MQIEAMKAIDINPSTGGDVPSVVRKDLAPANSGWLTVKMLFLMAMAMFPLWADIYASSRVTTSISTCQDDVHRDVAVALCIACYGDPAYVSTGTGGQIGFICFGSFLAVVTIILYAAYFLRTRRMLRLLQYGFYMRSDSLSERLLVTIVALLYGLYAILKVVMLITLTIQRTCPTQVQLNFLAPDVRGNSTVNLHMSGSAYDSAAEGLVRVVTFFFAFVPTVMWLWRHGTDYYTDLPGKLFLKPAGTNDHPVRNAHRDVVESIRYLITIPIYKQAIQQWAPDASCIGDWLIGLWVPRDEYGEYHPAFLQSLAKLATPIAPSP